MFSSAHATNDSLSLYVTQFERASNRHLNGQPEIVRVRQIAGGERETWILCHNGDLGLCATALRPYPVVKQCPDGWECTA
jgi:hypothetical protein